MSSSTVPCVALAHANRRRVPSPAFIWSSTTIAARSLYLTPSASDMTLPTAFLSPPLILNPYCALSCAVPLPALAARLHTQGGGARERASATYDCHHLTFVGMRDA
eukprot:4673101-Pleurochrysis_carterae.AAC.1